MITENETLQQVILPAPRELRNPLDVVYYAFDPHSDGYSGSVKALSGKNLEVASTEVEQLKDGSFRITCTRDGEYVIIDFAITRNSSTLKGHIDGQPFQIDGCGEPTIKVKLTDKQRHVLEVWNGAHDAFIGVGEAFTVRSDTGCVLTALGVGFAGVACLEGALAGCAAGFYGLTYLSDHCTAPPVEF